MTDVGYAAAILLAGVFVVAAAAKMRTPQATATTFRRLGLPVSRALARMVPVTELIVATTLLAAPRAGAAMAIVLLGAFTVVLARAVRHGLDVNCGCFGTTSNTAVTPVTLLRNALLLLVAGAAAAAPEPKTPSLAALVLVSVSAVLGAVALAAIDLRRATGSFWKVDLP